MGTDIEFSREGFLEQVIKVTATPIIVTGWLPLGHPK